MKNAIIVAAALALAGCQTSEELHSAVAMSQPVPPAIKAAIVAAARDTLVDPYSVRDAEISHMMFNAKSGLHWVCVKANSKNRMGGYTGRQALEVWVRNGQLAGNLPNSPACNLPSLRWEPFTELEALKSL
ncbi:MAG: hypothetical protein WBF87_12810 [Mesorhizobium sp.]